MVKFNLRVGGIRILVLLVAALAAATADEVSPRSKHILRQFVPHYVSVSYIHRVCMAEMGFHHLVLCQAIPSQTTVQSATVTNASNAQAPPATFLRVSTWLYQALQTLFVYKYTS